MEVFNIISKCDICKDESVFCKEVTLLTKEREEKIEKWCEKCSKKIDEEIAKQNELDMYEVYEDIIRSSY